MTFQSKEEQERHQLYAEIERLKAEADERVSLAGRQALDVFRAGYSTSTYYPPQFNAALDTLAKESAALRAEIKRLEKNATELRAEIERLRAELEVEEAYNRVIGDLVRQRDDAEAKLERVVKLASVRRRERGGFELVNVAYMTVASLQAWGKIDYAADSQAGGWNAAMEAVLSAAKGEGSSDARP